MPFANVSASRERARVGIVSDDEGRKRRPIWYTLHWYMKAGAAFKVRVHSSVESTTRVPEPASTETLKYLGHGFGALGSTPVKPNEAEVQRVP